MAEETKTLICPWCPEGLDCDHTEDEKLVGYREKGIEPEYREPIYDSTNVADISRKRNKGRRAVLEAEADLRAVMQTPQGRRFVARLFERCGLNRRSFNPQLPDAQITAFLEGQRDVALALQADVERICPAEYFLLLKERTNAAA